MCVSRRGCTRPCSWLRHVYVGKASGEVEHTALIFSKTVAQQFHRYSCVLQLPRSSHRHEHVEARNDGGDKAHLFGLALDVVLEQLQHHVTAL